MKTINNFTEIIIVKQTQNGKYSIFDNCKNFLIYIFLVAFITIVISNILFSVDILDIKIASAAENIKVCCLWNENLDDGILTYAVDSDNKPFNKIVDATLYTWQEKMKNIISFVKIKEVSSADILFISEKNQGSMDKNEEIYGYVDSRKYENYEVLANTIITLVEDGKDKIIEYADITVWSASFTPELMEKYGYGKYTAYNAILHEIGHVLGLDHSDSMNGLMSPMIEFYGIDDKPLTVSNCDAHTALDQNGMLYYYTEEEFPTYSTFVGVTGDDQESQGYYECII